MLNSNDIWEQFQNKKFSSQDLDRRRISIGSAKNRTDQSVSRSIFIGQLKIEWTNQRPMSHLRGNQSENRQFLLADADQSEASVQNAIDQSE